MDEQIKLKGGEVLTLTDGTAYHVKKTHTYHTEDRRVSQIFGEPTEQYSVVDSLRLEWNVLNFVEGPPLLIQSLVDDAVKGGAVLS